jgi:hypothetical protein
MTTDKIKSKIGSFVSQYQENSGTFEGFRIIFDFVGFLKSEPYLQKILGDVLERAESQKQIMLQMKETKELDKYDPSKMVFDLKNPVDSSALPVFKQENDSWQKKIKNQEDLNIFILLPIYLLDLIIVHDLMAKAQDNIKSNNPEEANRLAQIAKEESFSLAPINVKDVQGDLKSATVSTASFHLECMGLIGKYILDTIGAEEFLANSKPKLPISFDKDNSVLNIRGEEIKIARQKDRPIDHYILECIFSKDDISDPADFSEISRDYLKEEYDKAKDWNKFRHACDNLNKKIEKDTRDKINDFLIYSTEKLGWCKINQKHL